MNRSRTSAKKAGSAFETLIVDYLASHIDDRIERRARNGAKDRGDISGLRVHGKRVVVECKDYGGRLAPGIWMTEADVERGHDDALIGLVTAKRRGTRDPGSQWVLMTVRDLTALVTGKRPEEIE